MRSVTGVGGDQLIGRCRQQQRERFEPQRAQLHERNERVVFVELNLGGGHQLDAVRGAIPLEMHQKAMRFWVGSFERAYTLCVAFLEMMFHELPLAARRAGS